MKCAHRALLAGIPGFGLLYGVVLLLIVIPMALIYTLMFGSSPWTSSRGLQVNLTRPAPVLAGLHEECVIVAVRRGPSANEPEIRLNSKSVSWADFPVRLRSELSRRADRVVFVEGEGNVAVSDVVRVDDTREAWYGVTVVLLTPELKKTLGSVCTDDE